MLELSLPYGGNVELQTGLPDEYTGPILVGSVSKWVKTPTIELAVQELECEGFSMRFAVGKFLKHALATGQFYRKGLYSYFMLKGAAKKKIDAFGRLHLRTDHYASIYTAKAQCEVVFERVKEFQVFDLFYSPSLIQELLPYFPELKQVISDSKSQVFEFKSRLILPSMKEVIHQILHCPYEDDAKQFYFEIKARELLFQILRSQFNLDRVRINFTNREKAKILKAKSILENHIAEKPPSIKSLSNLVSLNEFKLKVGFRQLFNSGIFEWLMNKRLMRAKELLQTTDIPLKELCKMVGYRRSSNFVTAFRKRFGVTPGSFRRE